jgi:hypothetical protein
MTKSTWTGAVNSDWADANNWSPAGIPGVNSDVVIATGAPVVSASIGTVKSITDSSHLSFESAGTNTVATTLDNSGSLYADQKAGEGGTILNIGGTLTNSGSLTIGNTTLSASVKVTEATLDNTGKILLNGSTNRALLDVTAGSAGFGVAGVLSGYVRLAGDSAIEFKGGEITSLAASASLVLDGNDAFIEDRAARGKNSALTGLATIDAGASFELNDQASVTTIGALVNDGNIYLDANAGDGGSSLTLAGALTNSGDLSIGNPTLSASDKVRASSLDNMGLISLNGSGANQALLDVTGSAGFGTAGVLSGGVALTGDSAIEFKSGQITSLAGTLDLNGSDAFIEDSTARGSNSALSGLATIGAGASLTLESKAAVSISGSLVNDGTVYLDDITGDTGGSTLSIGGALTNSGYVEIGNDTASDEVKTASLDNSNSGTIQLLGYQALLDVTGSAGFGTAGVLSGHVSLLSGSAIEFKGGQITSLAASAGLFLNTNDAFIEDSTILGSNSALTGLADVAGTLSLDDGASVSTTGALSNTGSIALDALIDGGGSTLSIGGALTNIGVLDIGNIYLTGPSDSVAAKSFVNSGTVDLTGYFTGQSSLAVLDVSGATTNNGSISITDDTEEIAGAVGGAGSFSLSGANLRFDSSVSAGQHITDTNADALILEQAQSFAAKITGFGTGDTIDATNFLESKTRFNFVENLAGTGGTLTLHDAGLTANILMTGHYTNSNFALAPDSGTGTLVKFV